MPTLWRRKSSETYLVHCINEDLSIVPREFSDYLNLITVREDRHDQGDLFVRGKGTTDQPFPGWDFTTRGPSQVNECMIIEMSERPTR